MERLILEGRMKHLTSSEISFSRLGLGFEKLDRNVFDPEKAYDKVGRTGVKMARIQSGWMRTEREEGVYDFAWLDSIVDNLIARGLEPWICLCYGNPIYTPLAEEVFGGVGCPPVGSEREMRAWTDYVRATVEHFKGRVRLYEIWNEPDCNYSWKHFFGEERDLAVNAHEYGLFAIKTAKAIKEADENAGVIGFGLAHPKDLTFVNNVLSTGLGKYIDYISFHFYSPKDIDRDVTINRLKTLVHSYNPEIKLIQGESGAQSRSDGNGAMRGFSWTKEKQMKFLLRTSVTDIALGVEFSSYFSTMDMVEALHGLAKDKATYMDFGYFGILSASFDENGRATGEYTEKPSYYALSTLATLLREDAQVFPIPYGVEVNASRRVNGYDCSDDTLKIYTFKLCDGRTAMIYWNAVDLLTSTYEGTVSFNVYGQDNDNVKIIDLTNGDIYSLPDEMISDIGNGGIKLKSIPVTDCPLAIVFGKEE